MPWNRWWPDLDAYRRRWLQEGWWQQDPIAFPHRYSSPLDREITGLTAALLALGHRTLIRRNLEHLWMPAEGQPAIFILSGTYRKHPVWLHFRHRFYPGKALIYLMGRLRPVWKSEGTIAGLFRPLKQGNVTDALVQFATFVNSNTPDTLRPVVKHLIPNPLRGSSCKRMTMFLRWMVRDSEPDLGLWKDYDPAHLVLSLDVHVWRAVRHLQLTRYRTPSWKAVLDATASLARWAPQDPTAYDVALWLLGKELSEVQ